MKKLLLLCILLFIAESACTQGKLIPSDTVLLPPDLEEFMLQLEEAVDQKNKKFIITHMSSEMKSSFGGDGGIEEFEEYWNWDSDATEFWNLMKHIMQLNGGKLKEGDIYFIPYVFSKWPEKYDPFEYMAITGSDVNIRSRPALENSEVLGQLSYDIVKVSYEKSYPPFDA